MIESIKVDGFKSLNNFEATFRRGLNILIGPNGSGKTNIVQFFEFMSYLTERDLHEAVSLMGGAGTIFTKIGEKDFINNINVLILGRKKISEKTEIIYNYQFNIEASTEKGLLYFKSQRIRFKRYRNNTQSKKIIERNYKWNFDAEQSIDDELNPKIKINKINAKQDKYYRRTEKTKKPNKTIIEKEYNALYSYFANISLFQFFYRHFDFLDEIYTDLSGGGIFNIVPSKIKLPEDIAKQPGIEKDGSGLAATLFAVKNKDTRWRTRSLISRRNIINLGSEKVYEKIIELTKLANPSIENLDVENNPFDNQLMVKILIKSNEKEIVLPLSAMSDGTIKWISLITAILTSRNIFSIEEPENFLHPWMQAEILKIMRGQFDTTEKDALILMSTHSETILNNSKPSEIIIISMFDGKTCTKRVENEKLLIQEINKTGFGLGYYYITGVLSDV